MDEIFFYNYLNKTSSVLVNKKGTITLDVKNINSLKFEVDYNLFDEYQLNKIIKNKEELFLKSSNCITYGEDKNIINNFFIPILINKTKQFIAIKTDNNFNNFYLIKTKVKILKNEKCIKIIENGFYKYIDFSLEEGNYVFFIEIYNTDDEFICENEINVVLKRNNYNISDNNSKDVYINFNKDEGDFSIILSADNKKYYRFLIDNIKTNDKIIEFMFYNEFDNSLSQRGKIGSVFNLISDKEIERIESENKTTNVFANFIFEIQELLSPMPSGNDIGIIRLPTLRSKLKDNLNYYYDLKCYIEDVKNINFPKENNILITDKFKQTPLFYKFIINKKIDDIYIYDENNKKIDNYIIEQISDSINIVYFQPIRCKLYFYKINGEDTIYNIEYKDNKLPFSMKITKNYYNENKPIFLSDIILKSEKKELEFEIVFEDHEVKNIILNSTSGECVYLENERVKINKKVIGIKCLSENNFELINMIGNIKNNRTDLIFLKSNTTDFVYYAKEFQTVDLNSIPDDEIAKMKIGKKYIFENSKISEVNNGPLELEDIKLSEIVFTDIDEYKTEGGVAVTDSYSTLNNDNLDEFFNKNVKEVSMEVINENY